MQESTLVPLSLPLSETLDFLLSEHFPRLSSRAEPSRGIAHRLRCAESPASPNRTCCFCRGCTLHPEDRVRSLHFGRDDGGARRPVTVNHDLIDEPGKENR